MGLLSKLKEKITNELNKVNSAERSQYSDIDEQTISELEELGLLDDGTASIENKRCNWDEDTKDNKSKTRTANLTKAYAEETPIVESSAIKPRKNDEQSSRDERC